MENKIRIRRASPGDLETIAGLYTGFISDSLLSGFGKEFVKKYLGVIIASPDCGNFIAEEKKAVGFIIVTAKSGSLFFRMLRSGVPYAWLRQLFLRPGLFFSSLELLLYPAYSRIKNVAGEFLFIAVDPDFRQAGIAKTLIGEAIRFMKENGVQEIKVSVTAGNAPVNGLLKGLGFEVKKEFRLFNKRFNLYYRRLSS